MDTPWDRASAIRNQALMSLPIALGTFALARYRARKLLVFLPAVAAFLTVWRKFVCARCRYYGRECSTLLGIATARMMPRDTEHELGRSEMVWDFAFIGALLLMPLRQVLKSGILTVAYLGSAAASLAAILFDACGRCENEFCPMKDVRSAITGD